jgi:hypothetical protein
MTAYPISPRDAHVSAALSDFASSYVNAQFIADEVSPVLIVEKEADSFWKRSRIDQATIVNDRVGARSAINEINYEVEEATYNTIGRGLKHPIPESLRLNADPALNVQQIGTATVMQYIKLAREDRVATLLMTAGNWASGNTGAAGAVWTDDVDGAPIDDMHTALEAIPFNGEDVRVLGVCSDLVWNDLSIHPQVMSLRGGGNTSGGPVTSDELAKFLGIDGFCVSKVHKNTANLGVTASYSRVWGTNTFAFVVVPKQLMSTEQMAFSVTFRANLPGSSQGMRARQWHDPAQGIGGTDFVAVELKDDEKVVQNDAGYLLTSVR